MINVGTGSTGQLLISCRKQSSLLVVCLVCLVVQIGLSFLLLPRFGLWGAVMAEAATNLLLTFGRQVVAFRLLRIHSLTVETFILLLFGVVSATVGFSLSQQIAGFYGYAGGVAMSLACCSLLVAGYLFRDRTLQLQVTGFLKRRRDS